MLVRFQDIREKIQVNPVGSWKYLGRISVVASYIEYGICMEKYPTCFGVPTKLIPVL